MNQLPRLTFHVKGDAALGCYFVKGNWRNTQTSPNLATVDGELLLTFELEAQTVRDLQELLGRAEHALDGSLARSARRLRMLLAAQLVGRVIPDHRRFPLAAADGAS